MLGKEKGKKNFFFFTLRKEFTKYGETQQIQNTFSVRIQRKKSKTYGWLCPTISIFNKQLSLFFQIPKLLF